jgi:hypothetical protein
VNRVFVKLVVAAIASVVSFSNAARADLVVTTAGLAGTQLINFDDDLTNVVNGPYTGTGVAPTPGEGALDSDSWAFTGASEGDLSFGGTATAGSDYARGPADGAVTTGGLYGFDIDNTAVNRALGIQPFENPGGNPNDFIPGTITLRVLNSTGTAQSQWSVSYDIFHFLEATASSSIDFSWAVGTGTPGAFTPEATLDFDSPATTGSVWSSAINRSIVLNTPAIADGANLFLRWTISSTAGNNSQGDQLGIDNISVTAVPEPAAFLFGGLICGVLGLTAIGRRLFGQGSQRGEAK